MLILSRRVGESLVIGDNIEITVTEVSGDKIKLGIDAPKEIQILRKELSQTMKANREAAMNVKVNALRMLSANIRTDKP